MIISNEELSSIKGGGYGWYVVAGGIITFIIGIIDGYLRPLKCN